MHINAPEAWARRINVDDDGDAHTFYRRSSKLIRKVRQYMWFSSQLPNGVEHRCRFSLRWNAAFSTSFSSYIRFDSIFRVFECQCVYFRWALLAMLIDSWRLRVEAVNGVNAMELNVGFLIDVEHVRSFGEQNTASKWIIAVLCAVLKFYVNHFRWNVSANLNRKR